MTTDQTMDINEFVDYAKRKITSDCQIGYVATARTPWNALSIEAVVNHYYTDKRGIIAINTYNPKGHFLSKDNFDSIDNADIDIVNILERPHQSRLDGISKAAQSIRGIYSYNQNSEQNNEIGLIAPGGAYRGLARIFSDRKILDTRSLRLISVDKALMSYMKNSNSNKFALNNLSVRSIFNMVADVLERSKYNTIPRESWQLFDKVDGKLKMNEEIRQRYSKVLPDMNEYNSNNALIITQPLSEIGFLSNDKEADIMRKVVTKLRSDGYSVTIRPHPREDLEKYNSFCGKNVQVRKSSVAVEREYAILQPEMVVGATSTALLTAKALYQIPSYTYINMIEEMGLPTDGHMEEFLKLSTNIVQPFEL